MALPCDYDTAAAVFVVGGDCADGSYGIGVDGVGDK